MGSCLATASPIAPVAAAAAGVSLPSLASFLAPTPGEQDEIMQHNL